MQKLLLANQSLRLKPLYGPFHRDMLNISWLLESIKSSLRNGYFMFQSLGELHFLPAFDGKPEGEFPQDFELVSFYQSTENFLIHAFDLYERHRLPLYSDRPLWVNLESINFNIREFFKKLLDFEVTGYMVVENRVKLVKGLLLLQKGIVMKVDYANLKGMDALKSLLEDLSKDVCILRVYELSEELLSIMLSEPELAGVYQDYEAVPLKSIRGTALLVSVSAEKYGYKVYLQGEEVYSEGFEEEAPFYELFVVGTPLSEPLDVLSIIDEGNKLRVVKYDPEHPILYFCPACWSVISKDDKVCPNCGYDLTEFHNLPYEYKLIMALEHPVKDMKKNVIYTIGRKDLEIALPHFELMISRETDPLILMEIADALVRMSSPEAIRLLRELAQHRYPVVRSRALMHLQRKLKNATE